jgi:amino acid transporter
MPRPASAPIVSGSGLHRVLGLAFGLAIGFGGVVGGSLLKASGSVAGLAPEPWLIVALWSACSLHSFLGANVVAELMTALPKDGGLFVIARRAFGDFGALVVGWADAAQTCAAIAAVTILFANLRRDDHPCTGSLWYCPGHWSPNPPPWREPTGDPRG